MPTLLSETDYRHQIEQLARKLGYHVIHPPNCRTRSGRWSSQGITSWPDDVFMRAPRMLYAEVKGPKTIVTPGQLAMLELLRACGQEAYLWRSGIDSLQEIAELLARRVEPMCPAWYHLARHPECTCTDKVEGDG